ncbi:N-acetylmuramoyl-L-alanine amidase [Legionella genomosp. 1]|uniref:N-acetylmuramoyl-L-alanine amidase n=1 Tax=Legionella genomosp. 1 TaxID=1093625 RepID=UPI0010549ADA|nr:peptidoglycan recognition family protein [Legionella genomosp. 1]
MNLIRLFLCLFAAKLQAFSCHQPQIIKQKPIQFDHKRVELTRLYQFTHYGIDSSSIEIEPKMIVLHWTCLPSLELAMRVFNPPALPANSPRRSEIPDDLNVSSHYLVDRDGSIYQLMPDNLMARHVIGLNHYAIGIENVGGVDGKDDLTEQQAEANAFLVCYLKNKYPQIEHVIGHHEYLEYKHSPLWLEKDPEYERSKTDPGPDFVNRVQTLAQKDRKNSSVISAKELWRK